MGRAVGRAHQDDVSDVATDPDFALNMKWLGAVLEALRYEGKSVLDESLFGREVHAFVWGEGQR